MFCNKRMFWLNYWKWTTSNSFHCLPLLFWSSSRSFFQWLSQFFVFFPEGIDSINHLLHQLHFRIPKSMLVGDIISVTSLSSRFSSCSSWLKMKFFTSCLQLVNSMSSPSRKINMNRGSHSSTKIGWAWMNVTIFRVKTEVLTRFFEDRFLNCFNAFS